MHNLSGLTEEYQRAGRQEMMDRITSIDIAIRRREALSE
jgi:hypothetical protein